MRFYYISDLHLETRCGRETIDAFKAAVLEEKESTNSKQACLVVAGDICPIISHQSILIEFLDFACRNFVAVIWSLGNHEYYSYYFASRQLGVALDFTGERHFVKEYQAVLKYLGDRYHNLMISELGKVPPSIEFNSEYVIVALSDWYKLADDFEQAPKISDSIAMISKKNYPSVCGRLRRRADAQFEWLKTNKDKFHNKKLILVGHFLPVAECISLKFVGNPYNSYFHSGRASDLEDIAPDFYIHGHTHDTVDLTYSLECGKVVNILCNPVGYPQENNRLVLRSFDL
jgi:hypothetical protein